MKNLFVAAILLLAVARVNAVPMTILFDEGAPGGFPVPPPWSGQYDWIGTYDRDGFTFSALIGNCASPSNCLFDVWAEREDPASTTSSIGGRVFGDFGTLNYVAQSRQWVVENGGFDSQVRRTGQFCVVGVDAGCALAQIGEPASWVLLAVGLIAVVIIARRYSE